MKAIGGYFGLELNEGKEYHFDAKRLNTGRNALEYILRVKGYDKVYLPYYTCDAVMEPIKKLNLAFDFYSINKSFEPKFDFSKIGEKDAFVYTNYFGLKTEFTKILAKSCRNLIVDNAQAFYAKPVESIDTFYSPRKFFGIPDGAYLYTDTDYNTEIEQDVSLARFEHLLTRVDKNAEDGYAAFTTVEKSLENKPIKTMSYLTQQLLKGIDYSGIAKQRRENFNYLNAKLGTYNQLSLPNVDNEVPLIYPLLTEKPQLRKQLVSHRIYTPQYWPNVLDWADKKSWDYKLTQNLVCLPIDQRYGRTEMNEMLNCLNL